MKIDNIRKQNLVFGINNFRKYKFRSYGIDEKARDLKNVYLHEKALEDNPANIYSMCCLKMIKKRLERYENHG